MQILSLFAVPLRGVRTTSSEAQTDVSEDRIDREPILLLYFAEMAVRGFSGGHEKSGPGLQSLGSGLKCH